MLQPALSCWMVPRPPWSMFQVSSHPNPSPDLPWPSLSSLLKPFSYILDQLFPLLPSLYLTSLPSLSSPLLSPLSPLPPSLYLHLSPLSLLPLTFTSLPSPSTLYLHLSPFSLLPFTFTFLPSPSSPLPSPLSRLPPHPFLSSSPSHLHPLVFQCWTNPSLTLSIVILLSFSHPPSHCLCPPPTPPQPPPCPPLPLLVPLTKFKCCTNLYPFLTSSTLPSLLPPPSPSPFPFSPPFSFLYSAFPFSSLPIFHSFLILPPFLFLSLLLLPSSSPPLLFSRPRAKKKSVGAAWSGLPVSTL